MPAIDVVRLELTRRETKVAGLVSQGLANKVVAGQLGVTEGTVKTHLHTIYQKLRVSNRAGLILRADESSALA
jgi:two-component system, NarL family, nitrate/nitrite response regulator NarL